MARDESPVQIVRAVSHGTLVGLVVATLVGLVFKAAAPAVDAGPAVVVSFWGSLVVAAFVLLRV